MAAPAPRAPRAGALGSPGPGSPGAGAVGHSPKGAGGFEVSPSGGAAGSASAAGSPLRKARLKFIARWGGELLPGPRLQGLQVRAAPGPGPRGAPGGAERRPLGSGGSRRGRGGVVHTRHAWVQQREDPRQLQAPSPSSRKG